MKLLAAMASLIIQVVGFGLFILGFAAVSALAFGYEQILSVLSFLVENWILQAILGGWIAHNFQTANARSERQLANLEAAYQRKTEAAKGIHTLIQRRIYSTRRYLATIISEPNAIEAERAAYREVVSDWNSTAPTHQMAIIVEFGYFQGVDLDHNVFPVFADIDRRLRAARLAVEAGHEVNLISLGTVDRQLRSLGIYANDLNKELVRRATIDRAFLDNGAPITQENYRYLSHFELIKALIKFPQ